MKDHSLEKNKEKDIWVCENCCLVFNSKENSDIFRCNTGIGFETDEVE